MRKTLSRVVTTAVVAALTTLALPAGTAAAASSASCPEASSTRLFTGGVLGGADNKLWLYQSGSQTILCFDFYPTAALAGGALVLNTATGLTPPVVTPGSNPAACTNEIVDISDPVPFRIALGSVGNTVCFTVNDDTTSITFGLPGVTAVPSVELWSDIGYTWMDLVLCAPYATNPALEDACRYSNFRLL